MTKTGFGTLVLESQSNLFSGGLNVTQGAVNTGTFSNTMTVGAVAGSNHMLGTGNLSLTDASSVINVNGSSAGTVEFAGGTHLISNGATFNVNNGAAVSFLGGSIDLGSSAVKGAIKLTGSASLGGTTFVNAAGASMTVGGNLTFQPGTTIAASGMDLVLSSSAAQLVSGTGAFTGLAGFIKNGAGTATLAPGLTGLGINHLDINGGTLDLGTASITTSVVNLGGGTLNLHLANQIGPGATINLAAGTASTLNLNGFDQVYAGLAAPSGGSATFNLGGTPAIANTLDLGTMTGVPTAIRISSWDGTLASSLDRVLVSGTLSAAQLSSVWFQGFARGAQLVGGELRPTGNQSSEWNGAGGDNLWGTGSNWVGGDAFNVPDHVGSTAFFGNLAGTLGGRTVSLSGATRTVGNLVLNNSAAGASGIFQLAGGTLVFDSGVVGTPATISVAGPISLALGGASVNFRGDTDITVSGLLNDVGTPTGSGNIRLNGPGALTGSWTNYTGNFTIQSGTLQLGANDVGTGRLRIEGGRILGGDISGTLFRTISNEVDLAGNFAADRVGFNHVGDITLDTVRTISVTDPTPVGRNSSTEFSAQTNLTGAGGLTKNGAGTLELLSANNSFSGGLNVQIGSVLTTLTGDLTLGGVVPGQNYLGSGSIAVGGQTSVLSVDSAGHAGTLAGSTMTLSNGGQFNYLNGGAFTLAGGTLSGGGAPIRGTLTVAGDLTFGGTALTSAIGITVDTTTNPARNTRVFGTGGGTVGGIGNFVKSGPGVTALDASLTSLGATAFYLNSGVLQLGANNQIAPAARIVLNGGAIDANNFTANLGQLFLQSDSSLLLGSSGGLTFASRATAPTDWVSGKILTLQNGGQDWLTGATYVRFSSDPILTGLELESIAFTGFEAGATVSTSLFGGFWTLLPTGLATNEWGGGAHPDVNWGTAANWMSNVVPNGAGERATIRDLDANLSGKTINLDANYTVGRLNIEASSGQLLTIGGPGTLTLDGGGTRALLRHAGINTTTISGNIALAGTTDLVLSAPNTAGYLDWTGTVSGAGGLVRTGSGTLRLSNGANSYAGGFVWQDPSLLQINADGALFGTGTLTIGTGGAGNYVLESRGGNHSVSNPFVLSGGNTVVLQKDSNLATVDTSPVGPDRRLSFTGAGTLSGGITTIDTFLGGTVPTSPATDAMSLRFCSTLSGPGGIRKTGFGDLVFDGPGNNFAGGVDLAQGRIVFSQNEALGTGTFTVSNAGAAYQAVLVAVGGTAAAPLVLSNQLDWRGGLFLDGGSRAGAASFVKFDHSGVSTLTGTVGLGSSSTSSLTIFGKNHILAGTGGITKFVPSSWSGAGILRFEGANTFSGGYVTAGNTQIGIDSIKDASGNLVSSALGTGPISWGVGGSLSPYSDVGTGIRTRRLSNVINLTSAAAVVSPFGDATTLILDTPSIALRNGRGDWSITVNTVGVLSVESQLVDGGGLPGGITKVGAGTIELKNGGNQISDGIRLTAGTLLATATGDVTTGRLDAGKNYLGVGSLILDGGLTQIATSDGSTVTLSGAGVTLNGGANLTVSGGPSVTTVFDTDSSFTGTSTTGAITTSGRLIKSGTGTTTRVGARLATPELVINSSTLTLTAASLVAGVGNLELNDGTLVTGGFDQAFAPTARLAASGDAHIDFGAGASRVTVGSLALDATGRYLGSSSTTLNLDNWTGNSTAGGGADQFLVTSGLSVDQKVLNIWFTGGFTPGVKAILNPAGNIELVPLAQAFVWDGHSGNGLWNGSNWNAVGAPSLAGDGAVFADLGTLNGAVISLGSGATAGAISFEGTQGQAFTLAGGALTLDSGDPQVPVQLRVTGNNSPTITAPLTIRQDLVMSQVGSGTLTFNGPISGPNSSITLNGTGRTSFGAASAGSNFTNGLTVNGGTLEIGGSSSLNGFGQVAAGPAGLGVLTINGGTLEATNGAQILHNGVIVGGDFTVAGTGPLTLAGSTGTVAQLSVPVTISVSDPSGVLTFGASLPIVGQGGLTKSGPGMLVLAADSNYSWGTTVAAGALQLGNGGTAGSLLGDLVNDGTLIFNRSDTFTFSGRISGTGAVSQVGPGTTILTADNTYTGNTSILAGTLQLGDGGASGSILGNVVSAGILRFERSGTLTFDGMISGAGAVEQTGTGTTILTGSNGYQGTTAVAAGALYINGDQSAANGLTSVASGARLGGSGIIGGDVEVASGGTLSPGQSPGTLTINGSLALDPGAVLDFEFGRANVAGGTFNDLLVVGGNVIVDGTLNVAVSSGGSLTPGLYRIINFAGTLIDNGLALGTTPSAGLYVQTSVANQVNLVNTNGLTFNFWDGASGPRNDNAIKGGDGLWQGALGNDNWTGVDGALNAPFTEGSFAIFTGVPGTVTVDDSLGAVSTSGMQFAVDGYQIDGNNLILTQPQSLIRVGDGSTAASTYTATIAAGLDGNAQLVKIDLGTLLLLGANSYTGGTAINGGTVEIGADSGLGLAGSSLGLDSGTLRTTADLVMARSTLLGAGGGTFEVAAGTLVQSSAIGGSGMLSKSGPGTLILGADNSYSGGTTINSGTLHVGQGGTSGSIAGNVTNNGRLVFERSDTLTFGDTIFGSGSLTHAGTGILILANDNDYAGGTQIAAGTLQLGSGGATGSIIGNVLNNGVLIFNRANAVDFGGLISGQGSLEQRGSGKTVLTGANSYAGPTTVTAGSLFVNGDQTAASGLTTAMSGATLGGSGTIGGDVVIADGATLSPGNSPGTLTIGGSLLLNPGSLLAYDFGQAGVVNGPINDLTKVGGDLVLDGTFNVTVSPGGDVRPRDLPRHRLCRNAHRQRAGIGINPLAPVLSPDVGRQPGQSDQHRRARG